MRMNIKTCHYPLENKKDLEEIPEEFRKKLNFVAVKTLDEVLDIALVGWKEKKPLIRLALSLAPKKLFHLQRIVLIFYSIKKKRNQQYCWFFFFCRYNERCQQTLQCKVCWHLFFLNKDIYEATSKSRHLKDSYCGRF